MITLSNYKENLSSADYYVFQITDENGNVLETINIGINGRTLEQAITDHNEANG